MDKPTMILTGMVVAFALVVVAAFPRQRGQVKAAPAAAAERFPGLWREELNLPISRSLVKSGVSGCGEYRYKESSAGNGEFLVQCSRDGATWRSYLVWPAIQRVTGPVDENDLP